MSKLAWVLVILALIGLGAILLFGTDPVKAQVQSVTLDWTAPGDDGVVGTASSYKMRYSSTRPDTTSQTAMDAWWASAIVVNTPPLPVPLVAGTSQSVTVTATFISGNTYYFVIQACDEVPNCSPYSNVAAKFIPDTIPPTRIINLFAR